MEEQENINFSSSAVIKIIAIIFIVSVFLFIFGRAIRTYTMVNDQLNKFEEVSKLIQNPPDKNTTTEKSKFSSEASSLSESVKKPTSIPEELISREEIKKLILDKTASLEFTNIEIKDESGIYLHLYGDIPSCGLGSKNIENTLSSTNQFRSIRTLSLIQNEKTKHCRCYILLELKNDIIDAKRTQ